MNHASTQTSLDAFNELATREDLALEGVYRQVEDGCTTRVLLKFPSAVLALEVDEDDDTIEARCEDGQVLDTSAFENVGATPPWSAFIGKTLGWGWAATNQQGYQDGILLSFGGLTPSVLLIVAGSSIRPISVAGC